MEAKQERARSRKGKSGKAVVSEAASACSVGYTPPALSLGIDPVQHCCHCNCEKFFVLL